MTAIAWRILLMLAQAPAVQGGKGIAEEAPADPSDLHLALGWVIGMGVVLGIAGYLVIRKIRRAQAEVADETPFSLSELRRIFESGEISLEEYEHMRDEMVAKVKAALDADEIKVEQRPRSSSRNDASKSPPTSEMTEQLDQNLDKFLGDQPPSDDQELRTDDGGRDSNHQNTDEGTHHESEHNGEHDEGQDTDQDRDVP